MDTDSDLIMSHNYINNQSKYTIIEEWVIGHAIKKKKDCPGTITSLEEDKSECKSNAEYCTVDGNIPTLFQSFPGYQAMLKLDRQWIITQFRYCVKFANVARTTNGRIYQRATQH